MAPTETVAPAPKSIEAQRAFITADRTAQLMAAGLSRQVAETSAHVEAAYYETLAARFQGALGNAEDLYRQRAARVVGPNGAPPKPSTAPFYPDCADCPFLFRAWPISRRATMSARPWRRPRRCGNSRVAWRLLSGLKPKRKM